MDYKSYLLTDRYGNIVEQTLTEYRAVEEEYFHRVEITQRRSEGGVGGGRILYIVAVALSINPRLGLIEPVIYL